MLANIFELPNRETDLRESILADFHFYNWMHQITLNLFFILFCIISRTLTNRFALQHGFSDAQTSAFVGIAKELLDNLKAKGIALSLAL